MFVGVDAHIDPAVCNRKIARIFGENVKRPVGADRGVRPYGCIPFRIGAPKFVTLYRTGGVEPRPYGSLGNAVKICKKPGGENPLPAELYCKTFIASSVTPYSTGWWTR